MSDKYKTIDLCGRVPYGVKCHVDNFDRPVFTPIGVRGTSVARMMARKPYYHYIDTVKAYIRPMSSLTEDERDELIRRQDTMLYSGNTPLGEAIMSLLSYVYEHHIDYFGLIEQGLALEAPEDMY